jgi:hypothetical protein
MPKQKSTTLAATASSCLTLMDRKRIVVDFLQGITRNALASKYNVAVSTINSIVADDSPDRARSSAQEDLLNAHIAFENAAIRQIKEAIFRFSMEALRSDPGSERHLHYIDKVEKLLKTIDNMERLNDNRATSITRSDSITRNVDINELMNTLKTTDGAKKYLLEQMERQVNENLQQ